MTALTTSPARTGRTGHLEHLADAPSDRRCPGNGGRRATHRFPAATYLCRKVAREERAIAQQALETEDRTTSHSVSALALAGTALFAAVLVLLATGRAESGTGVRVLVAVAAALVVTVVALVAVLRRHEREHDALAHRVRMYDARLQQLRTAR
ncbi:hypothetical protein [Terrabacter sp. NPDC080008]|uniref:hypothetical protein n=1 Tax=Terrabacter sp. NPDC080008 TaxID=3155176 RepID=UPI00344BE98E